jgi:hypothetical protein
VLTQAASPSSGLPVWTEQINGVEYSGNSDGTVYRYNASRGSGAAEEVQGEALFRKWRQKSDPAAIELEKLYNAAVKWRNAIPPLHASNGDTVYQNESGSYKAFFFRIRERNKWVLNDCGTQILALQRYLNGSFRPLKYWSLDRSVGVSNHYGRENVLVLIPNPNSRNPMPKMVFDLYKSQSSDIGNFPIQTFDEYRRIYSPIPDEP